MAETKTDTDPLDKDERIAALEARLARLESLGAAPKSLIQPGEETTSRRGLFKVAGVVATGALAHSVFSATPAAAADGSNLVLGQTNDSTSLTSLARTNSGNGSALKVSYVTTAGVVAEGLLGEVVGSDKGAGVLGRSISGFGVYGESSTGYSVYAGGAGRIGVAKHIAVGPPSSGTYDLGDIVRDETGNMFVCVVGGSGPLSTWRKIAGPKSAGQLHLLSVPLRAYDSRPGEPAATGGDGKIVTNGNAVAPTTRVVSLRKGLSGGALVDAVPAGASAALFNLTTVDTTVVGYLSVVSSGQPWSKTSASNWGATGQSVAGYVTSAVNANAQIDVICPLNSTHFLIDVVGYYA
jgi:hypothetical protein